MSRPALGLGIPGVGDAVSRALVPGDAPQPVPALQHAPGRGPFAAVLREAHEGVVVFDGIARGGYGGAAVEHQPAVRRHRQMWIAQVDVLARDERGGIPAFAVLRNEHANSARAGGMARAFPRHAVPAILKANQVGEGVVAAFVPDFLHGVDQLQTRSGGPARGRQSDQANHEKQRRAHRHAPSSLGGVGPRRPHTYVILETFLVEEEFVDRLLILAEVDGAGVWSLLGILSIPALVAVLHGEQLFLGSGRPRMRSGRDARDAARRGDRARLTRRPRPG